MAAKARRRSCSIRMAPWRASPRKPFSGDGLRRTTTLDFNNDGYYRPPVNLMSLSSTPMAAAPQTKSELSGSGGTLLTRTVATVSGNQLVQDCCRPTSTAMAPTTKRITEAHRHQRQWLGHHHGVGRDGDEHAGRPVCHDDERQWTKHHRRYRQGRQRDRRSQDRQGLDHQRHRCCRRDIKRHRRNGALISSQTTFAAAEKLAATTTVDLDGDRRIDELRTVIRNADGSTSTSLSTFAELGQFSSRSFVTTSDDGRSTVTATDLDGNQTDWSKSVDTTLNADGSVTTAVRNDSAAPCSIRNLRPSAPTAWSRTHYGTRPARA